MKDVVENVTPTFNDTYEIVWKNGKTQTIRIVGRIAQSLIGTDLWGPCFTIVGLCYPST